MNPKTTMPTALETALALAEEHGDAVTALRSMGLDFDGVGCLEASEHVLSKVEGRPSEHRLRELLAVGFLAGRVADRTRPRPTIDTSLYRLAVEHDRGGTTGDREHFDVTSYGHGCIVEAVPVRDGAEVVSGVLAFAVPVRPSSGQLRRAAELNRVADALEDSARLCDKRADLYRAAGDLPGEDHQRDLAVRTRRAAQRARAHGLRLRWPQ